MHKKNTNYPIKVLYISHEADTIGGAFFSLLNLISSVREKIEPIVVTPGDGKACEELKKRGIKSFIVPFKLTCSQARGVKRAASFVPKVIFNSFVNHLAVKKIGKIINAEKINLIHSNSSTIDIGQKLSEQLNIKHIWHIREYLDLDFDVSPIIGWNRFLREINRADLILCVANGVCEHFKLNNSPNALVLYNAVRLRDTARLKPEKKDYILFCGRVIESKGIEDAVRAFSIIHKKRNHFKLVVAGIVQKNYLYELLALVNQLGISNVVDFIGFQENIDDLMADASCFLMCSRNEALGRVTIEAMFNGCPVIGRATGGTVEIIKDNETGFLYHTTEELAQKIDYVLENQKALFPIIERAQAFVQENFTEEEYSKKMLNIYSQVLA